MLGNVIGDLLKIAFGANPLRQWIGLGDATQVGVLTITWPGRRTPQVLRDVAAGQRLEIVEDERE